MTIGVRDTVWMTDLIEWLAQAEWVTWLLTESVTDGVNN
jgi:hypothetical protein